MAEQDSQYLIELDGNQEPDELLASVVIRLQSWVFEKMELL